MEGGPLLDMPQRSSLYRCCRSSCFFLRGFRVSGRTEKPRSGMWFKQWAGQTQVAPPQHPPAQTHTSPTSLFASPCCSQPMVQHCRAIPDLSRKPKGCSLCCSAPLHGTQIFGSQRTEETSELVQKLRRVTVPSDPAPQWQHVMLPVYQVLNQIHTDKTGITVLTSPPIPVLSPALRIFWPGS